MGASKDDYFTRNNMNFRKYRDGTEGLKILLTFKNKKLIAALEKAVTDSGGGRAEGSRAMERFVLNAFDKIKKF